MRSRVATACASSILFIAVAAGCAEKGGHHDDAPAEPARGTTALRETPPAEREAMAAEPRARATRYEHPGFHVYEDEGRLWVFREGSQGLTEFLQSGEPAKCVTFVGQGPERKTLRSDERDVLIAYTSTRPGFRVFVDDGRLWVFRDGSEGLQEYLKTGEPGKNVTFIGRGPRRMTLRSDERATLEAYLEALK